MRLLLFELFQIDGRRWHGRTARLRFASGAFFFFDRDLLGLLRLGFFLFLHPYFLFAGRGLGLGSILFFLDARFLLRRPGPGDRRPSKRQTLPSSTAQGPGPFAQPTGTRFVNEESWFLLSVMGSG